MNKMDLTQGNIFRNLLRFSVPYLISCFLQTFYGLADLFVTGQFNGAEAITAVSVGSQVTHMLTVVIVGFAMGTTVAVSRAAGARDGNRIRQVIGSSVILFAGLALLLTVGTVLGMEGILKVLSVPGEALEGTRQYLLVCFLGIVCITAYNLLSSVLRGMGDSRTPLYFVAAAGVINVGLDYLLIGGLGLGAFGAALATVISQALSVLMALFYVVGRIPEIRLSRRDLTLPGRTVRDLLVVGGPVAAQDGLIQVAFLTITVIANRRGLDAAAAVGIVEKIIGFLFLVPSAMLSAVSTITSANIGARTRERGRKTLVYGIGVCVGVGLVFALLCLPFAEDILRIFAREEEQVILMGGQYLRSYAFDCAAAGIHFCFSGYFCAYGKAYLSFLHNILSIVLVRIPGAYLASVFFPDSLFPMGMAAPLGSLLSAGICLAAYLILRRRQGEFV